MSALFHPYLCGRIATEWLIDMKIKNNRFLLGVLIAAMYTAALTGCGAETESIGKNLAIIYSNCQGTALMDVSELKNTLTNAFVTDSKTGAYVYTIGVDGDPYVQDAIHVQADEKNYSTSRKKKRAQEHTTEVMDSLDSIQAKTRDVDPLGSLRLAAEKLAGKAGENTIYAYMSGISTVDGFDMSRLQCIHEMDVEDTLEQLNQEKMIPDFSDIDRVVIIGLAQTSAPQQDLTPDDKEVLEQLWTEIIEAGGSTVTFASADEKDETCDADLPAVKTVPVVNGGVHFQTHKLDSEALFVSNEAILLDEQAVRVALAEDADTLKKNQNLRVIVLGTTATGQSEEQCQKLSEDRAACIQSVLISMGVGADQITTVGMAYNDPYHIDDLDEDGHLIESKAAQNRAVYILDETTAKNDGII